MVWTDTDANILKIYSMHWNVRCAAGGSEKKKKTQLLLSYFPQMPQPHLWFMPKYLALQSLHAAVYTHTVQRNKQWHSRALAACVWRVWGVVRRQRRESGDNLGRRREGEKGRIKRKEEREYIFFLGGGRQRSIFPKLLCLVLLFWKTFVLLQIANLHLHVASL